MLSTLPLIDCPPGAALTSKRPASIMQAKTLAHSRPCCCTRASRCSARGRAAATCREQEAWQGQGCQGCKYAGSLLVGCCQRSPALPPQPAELSAARVVLLPPLPPHGLATLPAPTLAWQAAARAKRAAAWYRPMRSYMVDRHS